MASLLGQVDPSQLVLHQGAAEPGAEILGTRQLERELGGDQLADLDEGSGPPGVGRRPFEPSPGLLPAGAGAGGAGSAGMQR